MWFEDLTGFTEISPEEVRQYLSVSGDTLTSLANGKSYTFGRLEIPTLAELRQRAETISFEPDYISLREVVANVQTLHLDPIYHGAFFQAASQFNLLEMTSPRVTPEEGVGIYEYDRTQGPACAIAAGAGTIYRNYFAEVKGQIGQSASLQIDCLEDIGMALGNTNDQLWHTQNGYALASAEGLSKISATLESMSEEEIDALRGKLRIGLQWNTQVTLNQCTHLVTQAYCSALPVGYSPHSSQAWENFARLVLEATYEATLAAAALNYEATGNDQVFLTLVGGGVFGNEWKWIREAIERALKLYAAFPLDVSMVSYGSSNEQVREMIRAGKWK
ncbi:MAG: hypothetical protein R3B93_15775 [Bacteroidia bacterium]